MNEVIEFVDVKQTMSSLEIARLTGKDHAHVMRDIRNMEPAWEKISQSKFGLASYSDAQGKQRPCYELTKTECLYVATKFNDEARAKLVLRWEELERKERANMIALPDFTDPAEAAIAWAKQYNEKKVLLIENKQLEEENIQLAVENQELKNDKNYLDLIMRSKALLTVSQIAQDYGMSGKALNKKLSELGIQYSINGQWILYAKYKDCGYVSSRSIDIVRANGMPDVVLHTEWTQAGRKFLYEELKKQGIIPMLERS